MFSLSNEQARGERGSDIIKWVPVKTSGLFTLRLAKPHNSRSLHLRDVTASGPAQRPYGLPSFGGF
jgi:hypothetical protein